MLSLRFPSLPQPGTASVVACVLAFAAGATRAADPGPTSRPAAAGGAAPPKLVLHLSAKDDWGGAPRADVEAVLRSAGRELLRHFPGAEIEPIRVSPRGGPITLYRRADDGAIVMRLNTGDTYWAQYAYQFAHELTHVLCRYREGDTGNKWFEEAVCELGSLFVVRRMGERWATDPPYRNWTEFAPRLTDYAAKRIDKAKLPEGTTLARWYADNEAALRGNAEDRERNTVVAAALLPLFEAEPQHWAAVYHLNDARPETPETARQFLRRWHDHTPPAHQGFVRRIAAELGVALAAPAGE